MPMAASSSSALLPTTPSGTLGRLNRITAGWANGKHNPVRAIACVASWQFEMPTVASNSWAQRPTTPSGTLSRLNRTTAGSGIGIPLWLAKTRLVVNSQVQQEGVWRTVRERSSGWAGGSMAKGVAFFSLLFSVPDSGQFVRHAHGGALLSRPTRTPFFQKCRDTLLSVGGERIHAHHLFGIGVGFRLVEINLGVERLLTQRHRQRAGFGDSSGEIVALLR